MAHDIFGRDTGSFAWQEEQRHQEHIQYGIDAARQQMAAEQFEYEYQHRKDADFRQGLTETIKRARRKIGLHQPLLPEMADMYEDQPDCCVVQPESLDPDDWRPQHYLE